MKCPNCNIDMTKGVLEANTLGSLTQMGTMMKWCPIDEKGKKNRKESIELSLHGEGYYCDTCMKVYGIFEQIR